MQTKPDLEASGEETRKAGVLPSFCPIPIQLSLPFSELLSMISLILSLPFERKCVAVTDLFELPNPMSVLYP